MRFSKGLKRTAIAFLAFIVVILVLSQLFSDSFQFRMSDEAVDNYFKERNISVELNSYSIENRRVFYAATGPDTARMIIFIHGTPGAWTNFIHFLADDELRSNHRIISIERPGFGHSEFGNPAPSLEEQAHLMKPVLELNKSGELPILVGHSLGGPIAGKMALLYPELIGALVLVAPSIAPELEPKEPWRKFIDLPVIRKLMPTAIYVSNQEILILKNELQDLVPQWQSIKIPVAVLQGGEDFLVDPGNAQFTQNNFTNANLKVFFDPEAGHFIPWMQPEMIKKAIRWIDSP